jgi:hypothetical protein
MQDLEWGSRYLALGSEATTHSYVMLSFLSRRSFFLRIVSSMIATSTVDFANPV